MKLILINNTCCDKFQEALDKEIIEENEGNFYLIGIEEKIRVCPFCRIRKTSVFLTDTYDNITEEVIEQALANNENDYSGINELIDNKKDPYVLNKEFMDIIVHNWLNIYMTESDVKHVIIPMELPVPNDLFLLFVYMMNVNYELGSFDIFFNMFSSAIKDLMYVYFDQLKHIIKENMDELSSDENPFDIDDFDIEGMTEN